MIKAAVFDLDGTLLNTLPDLNDAMCFALNKMGLPPISVDDTRQYIGNGIKKYAELAIGEGADDKLVCEAVSYFKEYYKDHMTDNTYPYDGVYEMLTELKKSGMYLAVMSNKYDAATKYVIGHYFPGVFDVVCGECEVCTRKPDPSGYLYICKELNVLPKDTVMIGDSDPDRRVSLNAGSKSISVTWGYRSKKTLSECGATVFADNTKQLTEMLLNM